MQGQFSAYVNVHTGTITITKIPHDFEFKNDTRNFSPISLEKAKRDIMNDVEEYFEINYVPEENRNIITL
jgi:hypothetical protein